tara:strand:- start:1076 stop:1324 length:249 start_codon:yes stop_codon:yes gene_type:complete
MAALRNFLTKFFSDGLRWLRVFFKNLIIVLYYNPSPIAIYYKAHILRLFIIDLAGAGLELYTKTKLKYYCNAFPRYTIYSSR